MRRGDDTTLTRRGPNRLLLAMALAVYVASASVPVAWLDRLPDSLCPIRRGTGMPCPGCGLTHAFLAIGHGDPGAAMRYNALGLPLFALGLAWIARVTLVRNAPSAGERRAAGRAAVAGALVLLAYGAYRILVASARFF